MWFLVRVPMHLAVYTAKHGGHGTPERAGKVIVFEASIVISEATAVGVGRATRLHARAVALAFRNLPTAGIGASL